MEVVIRVAVPGNSRRKALPQLKMRAHSRSTLQASLAGFLWEI